MVNSSAIIRELAKRHIESVVSLSVFWQDEERRRPICYRATGSILHASRKFILIQTCSHTFRPFITCHGPGFDTADILNNNTFVKVGFSDGYEAYADTYSIDWWRDSCLIVVPFPAKWSYEPVKFIEYEHDFKGQSVYRRGTEVYSIFCATTDSNLRLLSGNTTKGYICGNDNLTGSDISLTYFRSDLRIFELDMAGEDGCSGGPVFNSDYLVMGMRVGGSGSLKFATKLNQMQGLVDTWFDFPMARTMNETVARAVVLMSELREGMSIV